MPERPCVAIAAPSFMWTTIEPEHAKKTLTHVAVLRLKHTVGTMFSR